MIDPFQMLYDKLTEQAHEEARHFRMPGLRFTASGAADCPWRTWYSLSGYRPAPDTPQSMLYKTQGNADHDLVRQMFVHFGVPIKGITVKEDGDVVEDLSADREFEVLMPDGTMETVRLVARIDGLIDVEGGEAVFEFKTMSRFVHEWLQKSVTAGTEQHRLRAKHKSYMWQMTICMALFNRQFAYLGPKSRDNLEHGFIYPDGVRRGIVIEYDPVLFQEILQHLAQTKRQVMKGEPPPIAMRSYKKSGFCGFCQYRYRCWDADERRDRGEEPAVVYPGPETGVQNDE